MSKALLDTERFLERIENTQKQLELLKRELMRNIQPTKRRVKSTLYGSVRSGDITEEMIEEAKHSLFRELRDL